MQVPIQIPQVEHGVYRDGVTYDVDIAVPPVKNSHSVRAIEVSTRNIPFRGNDPVEDLGAAGNLMDAQPWKLPRELLERFADATTGQTSREGKQP